MPSNRQLPCAALWLALRLNRSFSRSDRESGDEAKTIKSTRPPAGGTVSPLMYGPVHVSCRAQFEAALHILHTARRRSARYAEPSQKSKPTPLSASYLRLAQSPQTIGSPYKLTIHHFLHLYLLSSTTYTTIETDRIRPIGSAFSDGPSLRDCLRNPITKYSSGHAICSPP